MYRRTLLTLSVAFTLATSAWAEDTGKPKEEIAESYDGVKITCRYYAATQGEIKSVVILLHEYNVDPKKGDWDGLARMIAAKGFAVMRFDWRGHGESKDVLPDKFWKDARTVSYVNGALGSTLKDKIDVRDFKSGYYTTLVNDLAAVRAELDKKNDLKEINTRSVYIIAGGNTAPLVHLFLATEWSRPQVKPNPMGLYGNVQDVVNAHGRRQNNTEVAGQDYAGVVFLSPTRTYTYAQGKNDAKASIETQSIKDWVSLYSIDKYGSGDIRRTTSMLYLFGDKDKDGLKEATFFYKDVMRADGSSSPKLEKMKNTLLVPIKNASEKGVDLLGKNNAYKTEDTIIAFLEKVETDRKKLNSIDRAYPKPFRINLPSFGVN